MKTIGGDKHCLDYNNSEPSASNEKIVFTKAANFWPNILKATKVNANDKIDTDRK